MYTRGAGARWELALRPHLLDPLLRPVVPPGFRTSAFSGQPRPGGPGPGGGGSTSGLRGAPRAAPGAPVRGRPNAPVDPALFEIISFYQRRLHSFDSNAGVSSTTPSQSTGRSMHVINRSRPSSSRKAPSAERLNLFLDRSEQHHDTIHEHPGADDSIPRVAFDEEEPKTRRERFKQNLRIALPHIGLVILSAAYTIMGAAIFHHFEMPFELESRNETSIRVHNLKQSIIDDLWSLSHHNDTDEDMFALIAHQKLNLIISDVFHDYTKNYMTPGDIVNGTGPVKWNFGASIFFSWTAITTIGYGHIVPRTLAGRITCLIYALIGIPLILVTIADMGRFLSGGILWVHHWTGRFRDWLGMKLKKFCRFLCCGCRAKFFRCLRGGGAGAAAAALPQIHVKRRKAAPAQAPPADNASDAGTFEGDDDVTNNASVM